MTFYNDVITKSPLFNSVARVSSLALLEPVTRAAVEQIMADAATSGIPLLLFETYRSQQRQQFLYKQGATTLRTVGCHHFGAAADLVKSNAGQPSWEGSFDFLGRLAARHGLVWGGSWKHFVDAAHVQRISIADQERLFAGVWYPDAGYEPEIENV
jgi:hypothetical protein